MKVAESHSFLQDASLNRNGGRGRIVRRATRIALILIAWLSLLIGMLWAAAALWFDASSHTWLAALLCLTFSAGCVAIFIRIRPLWRAMLSAAGLVLAVAIWWNLIPPSNNRDWTPDVAQLPRATIDGNKLTIENIRNFDYRSETDYDQHWETRTYDLSKLIGVDMFLSYWGPTAIAHTITSWDFADSPPLAISIETRKEKGESYSAVRGFFRQFELYYVVADERDLIRLRTNFRGEQVYLYRLSLNTDAARAILLDYLDVINRLNEHPQWYNALTQNCTTTIRHHAQHVGAANPFDWRILANGHLDELGYERGTINRSMPFAELKEKSNITEKAKAGSDDFSTQIRQGLPERPPSAAGTDKR